MKQAERPLYATSRLEIEGDGGRSFGTGFHYWIKGDDGVGYNTLITNRHVVEGARSIRGYVHLDVDNDAIPVALPFHITDTHKAGTAFHPTEDLAAVNVSPLAEMMLAKSLKGRVTYFDRNDIPTKEQWDAFGAIEDVIMVGYPNGLLDKYNSLPLSRSGITATPLRRDFNGQNHFMVDMGCYPGSSGSPILLRRLGQPELADGRMTRRPPLLGVLFQGPTRSQRGAIRYGEPWVEVDGLLHLGEVIKSSAIIELEKVVLEEAAKANGG